MSRQKPSTGTRRGAKSTRGRGDIAVLPLTLMRLYFEQILAGKKKTEFREDKAYWRARLVGRSFAEVHFRNGYAADAPLMRVECLGVTLPSRRDPRFRIRLGRILARKNCRGL